MTGTLHEDKNIFLITTHSIVVKMENVLDKSVEKIKTHFIFYNFFFFRKSCRLWDNMEKYYRVQQATDDNKVHAHWMLDT